jgi:hypothetical protein
MVADKMKTKTFMLYVCIYELKYQKQKHLDTEIYNRPFIAI